MLLTASIAAIRSARLNEASLRTSLFSIAKIFASWRTGLEFRRRIRCMGRASAFDLGSTGCSLFISAACRDALLIPANALFLHVAGNYRLAACSPNFAALTERRYIVFQ